MKNEDRELLGKIGVDAGIVWIGDPCYVLHKTGKEKKELEEVIGKNWNEFCNKLDGEATEFPFSHGNPGLGVCISSAYGDGYYPVYGEYEDGVLARVVIDFLAEEEDEEYDDGEDDEDDNF